MPKAHPVAITLRAAVLAAMLPLAVQAQGIGNQYTPNSGSNGIGNANNATALSGAAARSRSTATTGASTATTGPVSALGGGGGLGGAGGNSVNTVDVTAGLAGGGGGITYRAAANVPGPAPVINYGPCAGAGVSLTGGTAAAAAGIAIGTLDGECRALKAKGDPVAMQFMCNVDGDYRQARYQVAEIGQGEPCIQDIRKLARERADQAQANAAAAPPIVQAVAAVTPVPASPAPAPYLVTRCAAFAAASVKPGECE